MRVYFEKPRTTVGWKGLINDPHLDGSYKINDGLRLARHLLLDLAEMGVPSGTEFLDMISPQYIAGLVSWGAIGARTTESQVHRQLVSGVFLPRRIQERHLRQTSRSPSTPSSPRATPHTFLGHTKHGQSRHLRHPRQPETPHHPARRPQDGQLHRRDASPRPRRHCENAGLQPRIMIDCSHANSNKDHTRQPVVCRDVAAQIAAGNRNIIGVMLESNLVAGAQKLVPGQPLVTARASPTPASTGKTPCLCCESLRRGAHPRLTRSVLSLVAKQLSLHWQHVPASAASPCAACPSDSR